METDLPNFWVESPKCNPAFSTRASMILSPKKYRWLTKDVNICTWSMSKSSTYVITYINHRDSIRIRQFNILNLLARQENLWYPTWIWSLYYAVNNAYIKEYCKFQVIQMLSSNPLQRETKSHIFSTIFY